MRFHRRQLLQKIVIAQIFGIKWNNSRSVKRLCDVEYSQNFCEGLSYYTESDIIYFDWSYINTLIFAIIFVNILKLFTSKSVVYAIVNIETEFLLSYAIFRLICTNWTIPQINILIDLVGWQQIYNNIKQQSIPLPSMITTHPFNLSN